MSPPPKMLDFMPCLRPPVGWYCTLRSQHAGPCPTWPGRLTRIKMRLLGARMRQR